MSNVDPKVLTSFKAQAAHGAETGVKKTDMFRVPPQDLYEEEGFNQRDYNSPECVAQIEGFAKAYAASEQTTMFITHARTTTIVEVTTAFPNP